MTTLLKTKVVSGEILNTWRKKEAIALGEYDVLKKIFAEDKEALSKIEKALTEIKKLKSSAKSSNKNNKGEFFHSVFFFLSIKLTKYRFKTAHSFNNLLVWSRNKDTISWWNLFLLKIFYINIPYKLTCTVETVPLSKLNVR